MIMQATDRTANRTITARTIGGRLNLARNAATDGRDAADRLIHRLLAAAEDSVEANSYSAARRRILRTLEERGPVTLRELPARWPLTPQHLAHLVHELEQDGLVESTGGHGPDSRISLTADGAAALASMRSLQLDLITRLLHAAAAEDEERTTAAWARLQSALDSHAPAA